MRVAALDLGSNTSLLTIADMEGDRISRVLHDETRVTRMGQGVHANRRFHPEALERLDRCFADYAAVIQRFGCERVIAVATSAARDVSNKDELLRLGQKHAIPITIITGEKEAQLTFRGALWDRESIAGVAVVDVGGGSTEVIAMEGGRPKGTSVDVGSVRLTEMFVTCHPVSDGELKAMRAYARDAFAKAKLPVDTLHEVVAVAGTPTTLTAMDQRLPFQEDRVQGYRLTLPKMEDWCERLRRMTVEGREALPGMQPKRADVIVAGTVILISALTALRRAEVSVSTYGVRYGVLLTWQEF